MLPSKEWDAIVLAQSLPIPSTLEDQMLAGIGLELLAIVIVLVGIGQTLAKIERKMK